jgi:hypothetical protein
MALRHLHTLQGIRRLTYFIGHISNNDGVGKLIHICIEKNQLEVGSFRPIMFLRFSLYGPTLLTNSWVKEIWSFLELFQGAITLPIKWTPSPQCVNDQSIMSLAVLFTSNASYDGSICAVSSSKSYQNLTSQTLTVLAYSNTHIMALSLTTTLPSNGPTNNDPIKEDG